MKRMIKGDNMTIHGNINSIRKEIESLKVSSDNITIYVVAVDSKGNESEPQLLLKTRL